MDSFTVAIVAGMIAILAFFVLLIVIDNRGSKDVPKDAPTDKA